MSSTSERGYNINVDHLQQLIVYAQSLGTAYQPSNPYLTIAQLKTLYDANATALENVQKTRVELINAVNNRQAAFQPLKKTATRIINALDASTSDDDIVKDARTIVKKLNNVKTKKEPESTANGSVNKKNISTSRHSYNSLSDNFSLLVTLVEKNNNYKPNETSLKVASLRNYLQELQDSQNAINDALSKLSKDRYQRNALQFMPKTGLVDICLDYKKYIKSAFGSNAAQYKNISNLRFERYKFVPSEATD